MIRARTTPSVIEKVESEWVLWKPLHEFVLEKISRRPENGYLTKEKVAQNLCKLFDEGCETAYVSRYRTEEHRLDFREVQKAFEGFMHGVNLNKAVEKAMHSVVNGIASVSDRNSMKERFAACESRLDLDDLLMEVRTPGELKTNADKARKLGLEPVANYILNGGYVSIESFRNKSMKTENDVSVLLQALIADIINKSDGIKALALKIGSMDDFTKANVLNVEVKVTKQVEMLQKQEKTLDHCYLKFIEKRIFEDAKTIKDWDISLLNRGEEQQFLEWSVRYSRRDARKRHPFAGKTVDQRLMPLFEQALNCSIDYFAKKVERTAKKSLTIRSKERAAQIFRENLEQLISQRGYPGYYVIALDPGSTVKAAFLAPNGNVIETSEFKLNRRSDEFGRGGVKTLTTWSKGKNAENLIFAIGDGCKSTKVVNAFCRLNENKEIDESIRYCIVPENGASKYSCTEEAFQEFQHETLGCISAVSIGRRVQNPMAEYTKMSPLHLGVGQFQHSNSTEQLTKELETAVRSQVSLLGVNANSDGKHLLRNVSGLNQQLAENIVKYREKHGFFQSRQELKNVEGITEEVFELCAGFLRIAKPDSHESSKRWNPLDITIVHPKDYGIAERVLEQSGLSVEELKHYQPQMSLTAEESRIVEMIRDIPDMSPPLPLLKEPRFKDGYSKGNRVTGIVKNRTEGGLFVFIGCDKSGLVPISQLVNQEKLMNHPRPHEYYEEVYRKLPRIGEDIDVYIQNVLFDDDGEVKKYFLKTVEPPLC